MRDPPFLHGTAAGTRDELRRLAQCRQVAAGATLFHMGDMPADVFHVEQGRLKLWRVTSSGTAVIVSYGIAGDVIGLVAAVQQSPYLANGTALTPLVVTAWSVACLRELMDRDALLAANVARLLAGRAGGHVARLEELASTSAEERVARALVRLAVEIGQPDAAGHVQLRLGQRELADLVGTTVPTVSRLFGRWRAAGLLAGDRGRIVLADLAALEALAEANG